MIFLVLYSIPELLRDHEKKTGSNFISPPKWAHTGKFVVMAWVIIQIHFNFMEVQPC
jgi:hypothetical protein